VRHILTSKKTSTKRKLAKIVLVSEADLPKVLRMIPYA
jgi:large subunit ribosomal protein L35